MRPRRRSMGCACSQVVAGVSRRRSIGASAAGTLAFDASQYIPPDVAADVSTAQSYYDSFSQAAKGITVGSGGRITLSDQASQYATDAIVSGISVIAPELGLAYATIMAIGPKAGPGPGVCAVSPPAGPAPSQLEAWPHFVSWQSFNGPYPLSTAPTFESYANPILQYNWELIQNCFGDQALPAAALLAQLVMSWNATHLGPTRTITRTGLNPPGFTARVGFDPIADALENAALSKYVSATDDFEQSITQAANAPTNLTESFQVNNGAEVVHVKALTLHHLPVPSSAAAKAPTAASSSSTGTLVVVGGLLAAGAFAVHTGAAKGLLAGLKRAIRF